MMKMTTLNDMSASSVTAHDHSDVRFSKNVSIAIFNEASLPNLEMLDESNVKLT